MENKYHVIIYMIHKQCNLEARKILRKDLEWFEIQRCDDFNLSYKKLA